MHFLWCVCLLISLGAATAQRPLKVKINQGKLIGKYFTTRDGRTICGFLGLPYAKPPVGYLRFRDPQWAPGWSGLRDATKDGPPCVQNNLLNYRKRNVTFGSEDCLYLNIFSPKVTRFAKLPVMVYIYGSGFFAGSSSSKLYGPDYILDHDVVLVVINYRVGPLGFLSTEDENLPGNYGLKDQTQALRWIYRNIHNFGGKRDSITLFGNSAGAASVHLHMMSPLSKNLFHAGISQSGSALCQWAVNPPGYSKNAAFRVARQFGCPTNDTKAMAICLRKVPANDITSVVYKYLEFDLDPTVIFAPTIEKNVPGAFLPEDPWTVRTTIPWMAGIVSEEGAMKVSSLTRGKEGAARVDKLNNEFKYMLPKSLMLENHAVDPPEQIAEKVRNFYFGKDKISTGKLQELINMYSDSWFTYCTAEAIRRHKGRGHKYYLSYKGKKSMSSFYGNDKDDLGVSHGDELIYLFPMYSNFPNRTDTKEDIKFSKQLVEFWVNFAYYGIPTPKGTSSIGWMLTTKRNGDFLNMSNTGCEMSSNCIQDRFDFWKNLHFRNRPHI